MSSAQFPILLVAVPLLSAFILNIAGWFNKKYCLPIVIVALVGSVYASFGTLFTVLEEGTIRYRLGAWLPPFGIEYVVDHLNGLVLCIVSSVGLITAIYSKRSVEQELPEKVPQFYTLYILLVTGLLGITVTGDAFNLYVLLEIAALTAYALLAVGEDRAVLSSFHYVIMGTIGACFYLLGVGFLYIKTGSLNMIDLHGLLPELFGSNVIVVGFAMIMIGVWVKMAFFPLHGWLPNAYTYAPSATSCLVAPLMTKVSVYVMIRIMFSVFSPEFTFEVLAFRHIIVWLAVVAIIAGSLLALVQTDFKKMLTYVVVAEVGYMAGGVWLANTAAITGAILHILNDALMTLCLFMTAGIIVYKTKGHQFEHLKGLYRTMPFTMTAFTVGVLSMMGVPPTCGFFSKWYLILGAIRAEHWVFMGALLFSSLVNAVLFFRIIEIAFFEPFTDHHAHGHDHQPEPIDEAPLSMVVPLWIVAAALVIVGMYTSGIVTKVIQFAIPEGIV